MGRVHVHPLRVYYEDTDHTGVVYHANYLKFCDRAREHLFGIERLMQMLDEQGLGFAVYRAEVRYRQPARFGDELEVRSTVALESAFRLRINQTIYRKGEPRALAECVIELVCLVGDKLSRVPPDVLERLERYNEGDEDAGDRSGAGRPA